MTWKEGATAWIDVPAKLGRQRGKIVKVVSSPVITTPLYLIQLDDRDWPHLECRDELLMYTSANSRGVLTKRKVAQ